MKRFLHIAALLLLLIPGSCDPGWMNPFSGPGPGEAPPEGTPILLTIPFGSTEMYDVQVGTKSESSAIDETRIHDLYVMIFDNTQLVGEGSDSPRKIYGRYFSYEHLMSDLSALNANDHECWFVDNKAIGEDAGKQSKGAVKISTVTCSDATLVVIANVSNAITNMNGGSQIDTLNTVQDLKQLQGMRVGLHQDVVIRKDLFLMTGFFPISRDNLEAQHTENWRWNKEDDLLAYNLDYQVVLTPVDAKVKFRVAVNPDFISDVTPVYWEVYNTPGSCYLDSSWNDKLPPKDVRYFNSQQYYFEGKEPGTAKFVVDVGGVPIEQIKDVTYYTFCFYMLENRLPFNKSADRYYQREIRSKKKTGDSDSQKLPDSGAPGYSGSYDPEMGTHYVENGDWEYAPSKSTYVQFDLVLTLTPEGIEYLGSDDPEGMTIGQALTSDAIFTVHLGDFTSSAGGNFNNYNTERGKCYTYTVLVNNSKSIFTEVSADNEIQAGQEGYLLLTDSEIINADCHYEYHQLTFNYRPDMSQDKFSWYVKTPFCAGGPFILKETVGGKTVYSYLADGQTYTLGNDEKVAPTLDYRWVKFGVNGLEDGKYTDKRHKYPGDGHYDPDWAPGRTVASSVQCNDLDRTVPDLMDITQLIEYIFWETEKETKHRKSPSDPEYSAETSAFIPDDNGEGTVPVIRVTAFIDEYYYEEHPIDHVVDRDLWRKFVNAQPREMHILSDARSSRDRQSDVILSSHSIIQQSIQTIYNIHAADLQTLWGTEHKDEIREKSGGWPYWPGDDPNGTTASDGRYGIFSNNNPAVEKAGRWNGRMNSAWIWDFYSSQRSGGSDKTDKEWETYLNYDVVNNMPELRNDAIGNYQGMAYSCLSRNRDNNGDGKVDRNEVRWYLAAINQLAGMWVGNESLSINARLYRPAEGQWRSHIVSSSGKRVSWAEEGGGATDYTWDFDYGNRFIWHTVGEAAAGESVRCLRNIGTYEEGGVLKDISNAPYDTEIDEYFTCESTDGGDSYTFFFDRLNPKSMRQLSEGELPYHDQFNIMNCVYMKFETQRRSENVGDTEEDDFRKINTINNPDKNKYPKNKDINKEVTALGYNPYCPPGYRFPNQSEMLLMSLYLPVEYFILDKDGNAYGGLYMPTRTYYDRGYYGGITSNMPAEDITREQEKIGWAYNTSSGNRKANNAKNLDMKRSRCVRDVEMTGYIEGGILMDTPRICPGDWIPVTLSFFSSGAAFVSGSLKLCYTDGGGTYHERDIPLDKTPTGMEYVVDQKVTIPSLASLEMTESDLDTDLKNMKFKITMRNAATSKSFELPVTMCSHMIGCSVSLPAVSDPDKGMPVHVEIGSRTIRSKLSSLVLHWKASDGSWQEKQLVPDNSVNSYSQDCYLKDIIGADSWATEANRYKEYQFYVTASCDDGTHYVSETISQQLFRLNYTPNPVPENGWTNISQCNATWSDAVAGLNFAAGDYIEVDMDLTNCRYKYLTGTAATDLGQDNLIQFSKDNIGNIPSSDGTNHIKNSLIWYYPSVQNLVNSDDPAAWGWIRSRIHAGKWSAYTPDEGVLTRMNLILDKDGLIRDGTRWTANPGDWNSRVKAALVGSSTVYIGSVEGVHHSRATYNYVRAVRVPATPGATPVPRP